MKKNESKTARNDSNFTMMMAAVMLSILFLIISAVMFFYPKLDLKNFTYVVGGFLLVGGAWGVCRYFLKEEFRNIANYDFSAGTILLILGCVAIIRAEEAANFLYLLLGIFILFEGVILLQYTVALKALDSGSWWFMFLLSAAVIVTSIGVLLNYRGWFKNDSIVMSAVLAACGVIGLLALLSVAVRIRRYEAMEEKRLDRDSEEDFYRRDDLRYSSYEYIAPVRVDTQTPEPGTDAALPDKKQDEAEPKDEKQKEKEAKDVKAGEKKQDIPVDPFEDEGIGADETASAGLKEKVLSLKSKKKNRVKDEDIFEDEDEGVI